MSKEVRFLRGRIVVFICGLLALVNENNIIHAAAATAPRAGRNDNRSVEYRIQEDPRGVRFPQHEALLLQTTTTATTTTSCARRLTICFSCCLFLRASNTYGRRKLVPPQSAHHHHAESGARRTAARAAHRCCYYDGWWPVVAAGALFAAGGALAAAKCKRTTSARQGGALAAAKCKRTTSARQGGAALDSSSAAWGATTRRRGTRAQQQRPVVAHHAAARRKKKNSRRRWWRVNTRVPAAGRRDRDPFPSPPHAGIGDGVGTAVVAARGATAGDTQASDNRGHASRPPISTLCPGWLRCPTSGSLPRRGASAPR